VSPEEKEACAYAAAVICHPTAEPPLFLWKKKEKENMLLETWLKLSQPK
jgi:hypothetical protein